MKKALGIFSLALSSILSGCNDSESTMNSGIITNNEKVKSPCIVEVLCNEPELSKLEDTDLHEYGIKNPHKYYDFCDSTVTIIAVGTYNSGPIYNVRSITDVKGTERQEMEAAHTKYQQALGL